MIQVIDNIIPLRAQERLKILLSDRDFAWCYKKDITYIANDPSMPLFAVNEPSAGYSQSILYYDNVDNTAMLPWCQQIIDGMHNSTGIEPKELIRIQCNLMYQNPSKTFTKDSWNAAHTDQLAEHKVLLYYVNDSDGDTFIFDQKRGEEFDSFTIKQRVTPKQGRAVLFNGAYFHSSSNPIDSVNRLAINFNFI